MTKLMMTAAIALSLCACASPEEKMAQTRMNDACTNGNLTACNVILQQKAERDAMWDEAGDEFAESMERNRTVHTNCYGTGYSVNCTTSRW